MFKQIKGIPMGGNASPLIADLFLANLEFRQCYPLGSSYLVGKVLSIGI